MIEDTYQSIGNLCCGVLSTRKPTLQFATTVVPSCDIFCQLGVTADSTSLCLKGLDRRPIYSLWSSNVDEINVKHLKLQSYVEKYEFQSMSIVGGHTNKYRNPSYLAGLPSGIMTMSTVGGHRNKYTNPSYLAGLPLGIMTMSIVGDHTNKYTNPNYFVDTMNLISDHRQVERSCTEEFRCIYHEHLLACLITKNETCSKHKTSEALINYSVGTFVRKKSINQYSSSRIKDLSSQMVTYLGAISNLRGGRYSENNGNSNLAWNVLENKLALIGRVPYDCGSSPGDCFFASLGHGLYKNLTPIFKFVVQELHICE